MRRPRSRRRAIETGDAAVLTFARRRTLALRVLLAGGALALLGAAAASARHLDVRERGFLPPGSTGVVVLDLSLSIEESSYPEVQRALRRLISADAPVGLVVFSDVPYELLPPGTPASELKPLLRVLEPSPTGTPLNPWWQAFRAGTRISSALDMARAMLRRDKVSDGYIVLVSDLETAPDDVEVVSRALRRLKQDNLDIRVIPLAASSDGIALFQGILGKEAFVGLPQDQRQVDRILTEHATSPVPTTLLLLGALLFAVLALHEGFAGRLSMPRKDRRKAVA
jgi:von Willebrand factor type A domain